MSRKTEQSEAPHRHANGGSGTWVRNGVAIGLAGLTIAAVKWMFDFMEDRTMWENRYMLGGAGIAFLGAVAYWIKVVMSFSNVGEKTRRKRVRSRWLRRRLNRPLDRRLKDIV